MELKFYKRFESFKSSLSALNEVYGRDLNDSFVLSGTGAKFSITFDLAWKLMKDILIDYYSVIDFAKGSPREVLVKSFENGLIQNGECWARMLRVRNDISHDYNGGVLAECCDDILEKYIPELKEFSNTVDKLIRKIESTADLAAAFNNSISKI